MQPINELCYLDDKRAAMTERLRAWCAVNSGSGNLEGLKTMRGLLDEAFSELGGETERVGSAAKTLVTAAGEKIEQPLGDMLRMVKRPQAPVRVLLTGHMDTVFGVDHPFQDEKFLDDDTLNAPGAADMKGGLLVMLYALKTVEQSPLADQIGFEVLINADEEIGSEGSAAALHEAAGRAQFACVYEPALADGTLAGARKGSGNFAAIIRGKSAHAGREHHLGRNAIAAAADFVAAIDKMTGARPGLTVNVAQIDGGGPLNVVPDLAVVRFNTRLEKPEDCGWLEQALGAVILEINGRDGVSAELTGGFTRPPKPMTPELKAFFNALKSVGAELGVPIDWQPTGGCCDGNNIAAAGIPVIDTLGVRGAHIHSAAEFAKLDSLVERAKLSALLLLKIAAGDIPNPRDFSRNGGGLMAQPFLRPVRLEDFDDIFKLAQQSGGGMTNLPSDEEALRARIQASVDSFAANPVDPGGEVYMMVLDIDGRALGTSAVFSAVGLDHGFVNYRINKTVHASKQLKKRIERRLLVPTHDFTGCGEVGSLFLSPDARGGGFGKFLARARYLFIASHKELVADPVCAELRGWRGPNGEQPFWDAIGKPFFDMEFEAADVANAAMGNQFIADLMPRHPIYVALLPEEAREILGRPHDNAMPAFNMLLKEGFAFRGYIDVFDGGPVVDAHIDDIKTIRESRIYRVGNIGDPGGEAEFLISGGRLSTYRVARAPAKSTKDEIIFDEKTAAALNVKKGDEVRAVAW